MATSGDALVVARFLLLPALRVLLLLRVAMASAGCHQLLPASPPRRQGPNRR